MSTEFSARTRSNNIKTLNTEPLDVLVIGGGIVGAGLIRDLALNGGIKAGLIEQGDFGSGTSSATSQLVHGGFRYLLKRDIDLVKKSRKEREILRRIAPNLVKPMPVALLSYKGDPYPLTGIQLAAHYYNRLFKTDEAEKTVVIRDKQKVRRLVGVIAADTLKGCVLLWDSTVAEFLYAYCGEMAITLDDLLWRRTRIGWTPGQGLDIAAQIAQFLSEKNGWDQARVITEVEAYHEHIQWLNFNL